MLFIFIQVFTAWLGWAIHEKNVRFLFINKMAADNDRSATN